MTENDPAALLTTEAVAKRYGVKPKTVLNWARDGRVPYWRIGDRLRFDPAALDAVFAHDIKPDGEGAA
jgi:excisionase family DNA binding protein